MIIKPAEMQKISVTGAKQDLDRVIDKLHRMELLDIDEYSGELDTGNTSEEAEEVSQLLVDLRSTISKLPEVEEGRDREIGIAELQENLPEIDEKIEGIQQEIQQLEKKKSKLSDQRKFFKRLKGSGLSYSDLEGTENLSVYVGKIDKDKFVQNAPSDRYEIYKGKDATAVFYYSDEAEEFKKAISNASKKEYEVPEMDLNGSVDKISKDLKAKRDEISRKKEKKRQELEDLSSEWLKGLEGVEDFLTERIEKAEAPLSFATTENTFIAYGWVPAERYGEIEQELSKVTDDRIHVQEEEGENPPVKHENNRFVQPFESLTDLVAVPRYNEIDPSIVLLLTFPLFFGFMIGDFGYGLTTLAVFYIGYRMIDGAEAVFKSLMYASVATMIFGLAFGDAFGFIIFGEESILTQLTGIGLFSQIPILFHRAHHLGQVFQISALIGFVHVNLGYLIGFYNEFANHGFKEAFLEKGSWLLLEAGAIIWFFLGPKAGVPIMLLSVVMLYLGEGVEGVVEIPSLLSNILSYLRIFGVSVAAVSLAAVVNGLADPLFQSGSLIGIVFGVFFLVLGHTFNTFIKIMEGFLQGIRLHYVEMFGKFYEGGGKKYAPFGANRS